MQQREAGEKAISGDEKGNLQHQGNRAAQHIGRLIMVLPVVGLQDHHFLVALEGLLDVANAVAEPALHGLFLLLHRVGALVEGKHQKIHQKAQNDDGSAGILNDSVGEKVNDFK